MRIGIFDSGLGGLLIARSLMKAMPDYDYLYLGDTKRVPYGNRSQEAIYEFTVEAVDYLFKNDCEIVVLACNTASAEALRTIQQDYLPKKYPERRVLGVTIPAAEAISATTKRVGVLATTSTVSSNVYPREIAKLYPEAVVIQQAAPLLVPLIEFDGLRWSDPIIDHYLEPLTKSGIDSLILGCTHYVALKEKIRQKVGESVSIISQDEILPESLRLYLENHPEVEKRLSRHKTREYRVTDLTENTFGGEDIALKKIDLPQVVL